MFWQTFAENYPFFAQRGFAAMIIPLRDTHAGLIADGTRIYPTRPGTQVPTDQLDAQAMALIQHADLSNATSALQTWGQGRVAFEEYLTPSGRTYDIAGIPPDIRVPTLTPEQYTDGRDPAFQVALQALGAR